MASKRYVSILEGDTANTYNTVYFKFKAGVTTTTAGTYFIRYQVGSKPKVDTDSFYIAAGGEYTTYEFSQSGLSHSTSYKINATLYVAANNTSVATDQATLTTKAAPTYYGKVILDGNGGTYGSNLTTITYAGSVTSTSSSATIPIAFADPGFAKSGYTLVGFSKSSSATSADYATEGTYQLSSSSTSSTSPSKVTLYAVWEKKAQTYYGKVILNGNGGTYGNNLATITYQGNVSSNTSPATIPIAYTDPGFIKSGYALVGFSKKSTDTSASYGTSGTYYLSSSSTSSSSPASVTLYAIWSNSDPADWSWSSTIGGTLETELISGTSYAVYPLTAQEWTNFIARIQQWASKFSVSLSSTDLTNAAASPKTNMKAYQAEAVVNLLNTLNPPISPPSAPSQGSPITESFINGLTASINSMKNKT